MSDPRSLRPLPLFEGCTDAELQVAGRLLTPIDASPGRVLMVQGDHARQFVIVEDGEVEVVRHTEGAPDRVVTVPAGSYVGEVGLLDHVPCTATVLTPTGAKVHVANAGEFRQLLDILPVACNLRTTADDRLAENELLAAS